MKSLLIANTVITTKAQAKNLLARLNEILLENMSYESILVLDELTNRLVNAGFITWDEADAIN